MKLLDLFCGGGGAGMGYHRAGFDVVGVDIEPQPDYPFPFIQADALRPPVDLSAFDLIHASPPCQAYTPMANRWRGAGGIADERPDLLAATRSMLEDSGVPYVIENVYGAPMTGFTLMGGMFGLRVHRPRRFEASFFIVTPQPCEPPRRVVGIYGQGKNRRLWQRKDGSWLRSPKDDDDARDAMDIDWLDYDQIREAIPPAYTEYIGRAFLEMEQAA